MKSTTASANAILCPPPLPMVKICTQNPQGIPRVIPVRGYGKKCYGSLLSDDDDEDDEIRNFRIRMEGQRMGMSLSSLPSNEQISTSRMYQDINIKAGTFASTEVQAGGSTSHDDDCHYNESWSTLWQERADIRLAQENEEENNVRMMFSMPELFYVEENSFDSQPRQERRIKMIQTRGTKAFRIKDGDTTERHART